MAKAGVSTEDKKVREQQAADYKAAGWTLYLKLGPRGGGAAVMVKRGK